MTRDELPCPGDGEPRLRGRCRSTIFAAVSGNAISITSPNSVPLPTDVRPTTNPPTTPVATAITRSRFVRMKGLSSGQW